MITFLAPVPIIHVHAMLEDIENNHTRFAFGSMALEFFEKNISLTSEQEYLPAYIYVSKSGESELAKGVNKKFGVWLCGRICGWVRGDTRGKYPKGGSARRPDSTRDDTPASVFWEIDNIRMLSERINVSDFNSASTRKSLAADFIPLGPMLVFKNEL